MFIYTDNQLPKKCFTTCRTFSTSSHAGDPLSQALATAYYETIGKIILATRIANISKSFSFFFPFNKIFDSSCALEYFGAH